MALFQKAPSTPEELEACKPLDIAPDQVLEMSEDEWYDKIYRGDDVPQLTIRAVLVGSLLGFLLAFTNLYVGLKTGWGLGVAITACILAFALWNLLLTLGIARTPMTILETNCMQSTASAAGYSTGGTMVSAIAALFMLSVSDVHPHGHHLPWPILAGWTLFLAALGTLLAIPMKRNMINQERLKFPSGTAAAVTLQSLYSSGADALRKARALLLAGGLGALFPLILDFEWLRRTVSFLGKIPGVAKVFDWLPGSGSHTVVVDGVSKVVGFKPSDWGVVYDNNPVMIAAGAIIGLRMSFYMLVGGLALVYVAGPWAYDWQWMSPVTHELVRAAAEPGTAWREIGLWLGVPILVSSGLLSFAMQWRTIARAFSGFFNKSPKNATNEREALIARTEVPMSWFLVGSFFAGIGVISIAHSYFQIPWYYGVLAVLMTFLLALVASRATGESDITPVGAMGKIMQLTYGVLIPQSTTANLMTAGITAGSAGSSADLLTDLKSGYLLGANPRRQFIAQFMGIFSGTLASVTGFYLLVPDTTVMLGANAKFPAPSAQAWRAVAEVFKTGIANMHPMHRQAIFYGLAIGVVLVLLEKVLPKMRSWLPSATGLGLGLILPFQYPISMFIGAVIAAVWVKLDKKSSDDYLIPVASGVIAGVSILGVVVALLNTLI